MSNKIEKIFALAIEQAQKGDKEVDRRYRLGAVGIRADGAIVFSNNVPTRTPHAQSHAEARLTKKLDVGSYVFVVRVSADNQLKYARPCKHCRQFMRARGVKRVYYSVAKDEYGIIEF